MIKGVLFDYDGTLVKSMPQHYKAWAYALKEYQVISKKEYYLYEGVSLALLPEILVKKKLLKSKVENLVKKKKKYFKKNIKKNLYYPGVTDVLSFLKINKIKIGLVTSSHIDQVIKSSSLDFRKKFDVIITGEDTKKNKPYPDPYLLGLKKLKLPNKECVVIENAPIGIKSSIKAGIFTIAVTNTVNKKSLNEADKIIDNLKQIKKYFIKKK